MAEALFRDHKIIHLDGYWLYDDTGVPIHHPGPKGRERPVFRFADQPKESLDKPISMLYT
jgi:hypothetical protein